MDRRLGGQAPGGLSAGALVGGLRAGKKGSDGNVGFLRLLLCRRLWAGHLVSGGEMAMMTLIAFGRPGRLWWLVVPVVFLAVYLVVVMWRRQPHQGLSLIHI